MGRVLCGMRKMAIRKLRIRLFDLTEFIENQSLWQELHTFGKLPLRN